MNFALNGNNRIVPMTERCPMYTSYFANWRKFPLIGYQPIGIVSKVPSYWNYLNMAELAPPKKMRNYTEEDLRIAYRDYLNTKLSAQEILIRIAKISADLPPVLCCYEKPHEFCHRHVVREWLIEERNVNITELGGFPSVQLKLELPI